jgi:hypothetical protein
MGSGHEVTVVVEAAGSSTTFGMHALVDELCDARFLASPRRSLLRTAAAPLGDPSAVPGRVAETLVRDAVVHAARQILHERIEELAALVRAAYAGELTGPAYRIERVGAALRITVLPLTARAHREVDAISFLGSSGTGELLAGWWVLERGGYAEPEAATGSW